MHSRFDQVKCVFIAISMMTSSSLLPWMAFLASCYLGGVASDTATCTHTFPDGNSFDLSGLVRPSG